VADALIKAIFRRSNIRFTEYAYRAKKARSGRSKPDRA
jgi:hypothetical protein